MGIRLVLLLVVLLFALLLRRLSIGRSLQDFCVEGEKVGILELTLENRFESDFAAITYDAVCSVGRLVGEYDIVLCWDEEALAETDAVDLGLGVWLGHLEVLVLAVLLDDEEHILIERILLHLDHDVSLLIIFKAVHKVPLRPHHVLAVPVGGIVRRNGLIAPDVLLRVLLPCFLNLQKNGSLIARTNRARLRWTCHILKYVVRDDALFYAKLIV